MPFGAVQTPKLCTRSLCKHTLLISGGKFIVYIGWVDLGNQESNITTKVYHWADGGGNGVIYSIINII